MNLFQLAHGTIRANVWAENMAIAVNWFIKRYKHEPFEVIHICHKNEIFEIK